MALAGTAAAALELTNVTTAPPAGAAAVSVIDPVDDAPPTTLVGDTPRADSVAAEGGFTVNVALALPPPKDPEIVTAVGPGTADVATAKVLLVDPAGTVTVAGSDAAAELSESDTTAPPDGAAR